MIAIIKISTYKGIATSASHYYCNIVLKESEFLINSVVLFLYLFLQKFRYSITLSKDEIFSSRTLVGYYLTLWKNDYRLDKIYSRTGIYTLYIPIKNKHKVEVKEEVERMIKNNNRTQPIHAKFSWLKTWKEVEQFKKDYYSVNPELIDKLISNFKPGE